MVVFASVCLPLTNEISLKPLLLTTVGLVATVLGMSVCREAIRLTSLGATRIQELIPQHAEAMQVEGFWVFLLVAVINFGLSSWCFWLVKANFVESDEVT